MLGIIQTLRNAAFCRKYGPAALALRNGITETASPPPNFRNGS